MKEEETGKFTYTYTVPGKEDRHEIENIRSRYEKNGAPETPATLRELRRLDRKVQVFPRAAAIAVGIAALLLFGAGIALSIEFEFYTVGVILGLAGIAVMAVNPFLFRWVHGRRERKYAEKIMDLSDKLLHE